MRGLSCSGSVQTSLTKNTHKTSSYWTSSYKMSSYKTSIYQTSSYKTSRLQNVLITKRPYYQTSRLPNVQLPNVQLQNVHTSNYYKTSNFFLFSNTRAEPLPEIDTESHYKSTEIPSSTYFFHTTCAMYTQFHVGKIFRNALGVLTLVDPVQSSNGNDIETKRNYASIIGVFSVSKRNEPTYSRTW
jgi:hypothetical protein